MLTTSSNIIALDMGERRIGVARASLIARLAEPLQVLENGQTVIADISSVVQAEDAAAVVVGLPRGLQGQHTDQTRRVEDFVAKLKEALTVPVYMQDEALTSVQAEKELSAQGKPIEKGMVDALAATYILEDFLRDNRELPQ
jgi:putative holliday junction resolvase